MHLILKMLGIIHEPNKVSSKNPAQQIFLANKF